MIYVNDMFNLFNTKINFRIEVTVFCWSVYGPPTQCWCGEHNWSHVHPVSTYIQLTGASHGTTGGTNITLATLTPQHAEIMLNTTVIEIKVTFSLFCIFMNKTILLKSPCGQQTRYLPWMGSSSLCPLLSIPSLFIPSWASGDMI